MQNEKPWLNEPDYKRWRPMPDHIQKTLTQIENEQEVES